MSNRKKGKKNSKQDFLEQMDDMVAYGSDDDEGSMFGGSRKSRGKKSKRKKKKESPRKKKREEDEDGLSDFDDFSDEDRVKKAGKPSKKEPRRRRIIAPESLEMPDEHDGLYSPDYKSSEEEEEEEEVKDGRKGRGPPQSSSRLAGPKEKARTEDLEEVSKSQPKVHPNRAALQSRRIHGGVDFAVDLDKEREDVKRDVLSRIKFLGVPNFDTFFRKDDNQIQYGHPYVFHLTKNFFLCGTRRGVLMILSRRNILSERSGMDDGEEPLLLEMSDLLRTRKSYELYITSLDMTDDESRLIVGFKSGEILLYDHERQRKVEVISNEFPSEISNVLFLSKDSFVASSRGIVKYFQITERRGLIFSKPNTRQQLIILDGNFDIVQRLIRVRVGTGGRFCLFLIITYKAIIFIIYRHGSFREIKIIRTNEMLIMRRLKEQQEMNAPIRNRTTSASSKDGYSYAFPVPTHTPNPLRIAPLFDFVKKKKQKLKGVERIDYVVYYDQKFEFSSILLNEVTKKIEFILRHSFPPTFDSIEEFRKQYLLDGDDEICELGFLTERVLICLTQKQKKVFVFDPTLNCLLETVDYPWLYVPNSVFCVHTEKYYILNRISNEIRVIGIKNWRERIQRLFKFEFYEEVLELIVKICNDGEVLLSGGSKTELIQQIVKYLSKSFDKLNTSSSPHRKSIDQPPPSSSSHKFSIQTLGHNVFKCCIDIQETEQIFDQIFHFFVERKKQDVFLSILIEYIRKKEISKIPYDFFETILHFYTSKNDKHEIEILEEIISDLDLKYIFCLNYDSKGGSLEKDDELNTQYFDIFEECFKRHKMYRSLIYFYDELKNNIEEPLKWIFQNEVTDRNMKHVSELVFQNIRSHYIKQSSKRFHSSTTTNENMIVAKKRSIINFIFFGNEILSSEVGEQEEKGGSESKKKNVESSSLLKHFFLGNLKTRDFFKLLEFLFFDERYTKDIFLDSRIQELDKRKNDPLHESYDPYEEDEEDEDEYYMKKKGRKKGRKSKRKMERRKKRKGEIDKLIRLTLDDENPKIVDNYVHRINLLNSISKVLIDPKKHDVNKPWHVDTSLRTKHQLFFIFLLRNITEPIPTHRIKKRRKGASYRRSRKQKRRTKEYDSAEEEEESGEEEVEDSEPIYLLRSKKEFPRTFLKRILEMLTYERIHFSSLEENKRFQRNLITLYTMYPMPLEDKDEKENQNYYMRILQRSENHYVLKHIYEVIQRKTKKRESYTDILRCYIRSPLLKDEVFDYIDETMEKIGGKALELFKEEILQSLPQLVLQDGKATGSLVLKYLRDDISLGIMMLEDNPEDQYDFLSFLIEKSPQMFDGNTRAIELSEANYLKYFELKCQYAPTEVYPFLQQNQESSTWMLSIEKCLPLCKKHKITDATVHLLLQTGGTVEALELFLSLIKEKMKKLKKKLAVESKFVDSKNEKWGDHGWSKVSVATLPTLVGGEKVLEVREYKELDEQLNVLSQLIEENNDKLELREVYVIWYMLLDTFAQKIRVIRFAYDKIFVRPIPLIYDQVKVEDPSKDYIGDAKDGEDRKAGGGAGEDRRSKVDSSPGLIMDDDDDLDDIKFSSDEDGGGGGGGRTRDSGSGEDLATESEEEEVDIQEDAVQDDEDIEDRDRFVSNAESLRGANRKKVSNIRKGLQSLRLSKKGADRVRASHNPNMMKGNRGSMSLRYGMDAREIHSMRLSRLQRRDKQRNRRSQMNGGGGGGSAGVQSITKLFQGDRKTREEESDGFLEVRLPHLAQLWLFRCYKECFHKVFEAMSKYIPKPTLLYRIAKKYNKEQFGIFKTSMLSAIEQMDYEMVTQHKIISFLENDMYDVFRHKFLESLLSKGMRIKRHSSNEGSSVEEFSNDEECLFCGNGMWGNEVFLFRCGHWYHDKCMSRYFDRRSSGKSPADVKKRFCTKCVLKKKRMTEDEEYEFLEGLREESEKLKKEDEKRKKNMKRVGDPEQEGTGPGTGPRERAKPRGPMGGLFPGMDEKERRRVTKCLRDVRDINNNFARQRKGGKKEVGAENRKDPIYRKRGFANVDGYKVVKNVFLKLDWSEMFQED